MGTPEEPKPGATQPPAEETPTPQAEAPAAATDQAAGKDGEKPFIEEVNTSGAGKGEYEVSKKEPEYKRSGYMKSEHEAQEAEDAKLPKDSAGKPIKPKGVEFSSGPVIQFKTEKDWSLASTRPPGSKDKTYAAWAELKTTNVDMLELSVNKAEGKLKATAIKGGGEFNAGHAQWDFGKAMNELYALLVGRSPPPPPAPPRPPGGFAPMAVRVTDLTTHGSLLAPGTGSPTVNIGSLPAWRIGPDLHACTTPGVGPHGTGPTSLGELTVLINSMPAARVGDWVTEPNGGPNIIIKGCPNVFIGTPAPAPPAPPAGAKGGPDDLPMIVFGGVWEANLGHVEAQGNVYADVDLKKGKGAVKAEAGAMAAVAQAKTPMEIKFLLPFTETYIGLGISPELAVLTAGAAAGAKYENGKVEAGAKVGVGPVGGGVKIAAGLSGKE